jgi:hypothetical protein
LILIFVFNLLVGKKLAMRKNKEIACSSRGRTIRPTEAAIAGAAFTRGNGSGARGTRGGRGTAPAPRGGRVRRLEFFFCGRPATTTPR